MSQFPTSRLPPIPLESLVAAAKNRSTGTTSISVNVPSLIQESETRQDALVYSVIKVISQGTDEAGNQLLKGNKTYALPAPLDIIDLHSANWEGVPLGGQAAYINQDENLLTALGDQAAATIGSILESQEALARSMDLADAANYIAIANRQSINPNVELAYRGPSLRQIQFQYRLVPLDQKQADGIKEFVDTMRQLMYPVSTPFVLGYPALFEISIKTSTAPSIPSQGKWSNKVLFSMGKNKTAAQTARNAENTAGCALTDLQVSYGEQGSYSGHADGSPGFVNLNLTFQETALSTRDSITQEYS